MKNKRNITAILKQIEAQSKIIKSTAKNKVASKVINKIPSNTLNFSQYLF